MSARRNSATRNAPVKRRRPAVAGQRRSADPTHPMEPTPPDPDHDTAPDDVVPDAPDDAMADEDDRGGSRKPVLFGLAAATSVAVIAAVLLGFAANAAGDDAADNAAYVDSDATAELTEATRKAVEEVFSYDHTAATPSESQLRSVFAGKAVRQYHDVFGKAFDKLGNQKLTLTTKVQSVGVKSIHDDRAQLLVFAQQAVQRTGTKDRRSGGAQLQLSAQHVDGSWKITNFRLL